MKKLVMLWVLLLPAISAAAVSEWVQFENRDGHIAIPIKLHGQDATAILDSGADHNGVSMTFLEQNPDAWKKGRAVEVSGAFGKMTTHFANNVELELFGVPIAVDQTVPMQLGDIDFLIGLRFFENFIVQIDYPNSRIRIIDHKSLKLKKVANVRMKRMRGAAHPVVKVDFNGEYKPWLMLDTGNNSGLLMSRAQVEKQGWLERFETLSDTDTGVVTTVETETFALPEFTIGPYTLENVIVTVPAAGEAVRVTQTGRQDWSTGTRIKSSSKEADGILGYDVLKHFVVTIDYKRLLLHIEAP